MFGAEKRAKFYAPSHTYYIDGNKVDTSVTRVLHDAFNPVPFDADAIIAKNLANWRRGRYAHLVGSDDEVGEQIKAMWATAAPLGTAMHLWIELYLAGLDQEPDSPETVQFKLWWDAEKKVALRTELIVWWENDGRVVCAGQIDALLDDFTLLDWKRVEKDLSPTSRVYSYAQNPIIEHIPDTKYHRYSLQLSMYWVMMEQTYEFIAPGAMLVVFYSDAPARPIHVLDYRKEARLLLAAL